MPCPALTTWVTCLGVLFCPVFSSSSVTDLTTRQRIHHLEFLQLNRRAVVIGVIVIVWFLRVCDNLCPLRLCDLVDPATKISKTPSALPDFQCERKSSLGQLTQRSKCAHSGAVSPARNIAVLECISTCSILTVVRVTCYLKAGGTITVPNRYRSEGGLESVI